MRHHSHMKNGPELDLERIVTASLHSMFDCEPNRSWLAGSLPIGAGAPDILLAEWRPEVALLSEHTHDSAQVLGYLRGVSRARTETIAARLRKSARQITKRLEALENDRIVERSQANYRMATPWRSVLSEVIAIEVKVKDWRRAVAQAARNSIFANKSLVALPDKLAARVYKEPVLHQLGLGLVSIQDAEAKIIRRPKRRQPRVWSYYYQMANVVASEIAGDTDGLQRIH